jgi:tetratricopeptide (TPR) repeat protein
MAAESVESLCQRAKQATAKGQAEEARQLYLQALGLKSHSPDIHYGLATVCFLLNDLGSAAHHFSEVMRLDPMRPGAYINLGAVMNRMGDYRQAEEVLRKGLKIDPKRAEGFYNLGLVFRNSVQLEKAVEAYLEAIRLSPKMIDAYYNLANVYMELRRYDEAAERYQLVLQLRPDWDKAVKGLAAADAKRGVKPAGGTDATPAPDKDQPSDPARTLDPEVHGEVLKGIYKATAESEERGREFLKALELEVEPALKGIYTAILRPKAGQNLDECVEDFEKAIEDMRNLHDRLKTSIERVRTLSDHLLKS